MGIIILVACIAVICLLFGYKFLFSRNNFEKNYNKIILNPDDSLVKFKDILEFPYGKYKVYRDGLKNKYYIDELKDMLKRHLANGEIYENHIREHINKYVKPGTLVLDIGAHIGTHTLNLSKAVGPRGRVIAFEPQPKIFRELFMNLVLNKVKNVSLMNIAVANSEESIELSPLVIGNEAGTGCRGSGTNVYIKTIRIDDLKLDNISLMKIDVEGMENEVLMGLKETIIRNKPILLVEIMGGTRYEKASLEQKKIIHETLDLIETFGYKAELIDGHDYIGTPTKE